MDSVIVDVLRLLLVSVMNETCYSKGGRENDFGVTLECLFPSSEQTQAERHIHNTHTHHCAGSGENTTQ